MLPYRYPCGKQHFREIPTPDFVSKCTNQACYNLYLVEAIVVKSLQNPAWVFRGNVVSHMDRYSSIFGVFSAKTKKSTIKR